MADQQTSKRNRKQTEDAYAFLEGKQDAVKKASDRDAVQPEPPKKGRPPGGKKQDDRYKQFSFQLQKETILSCKRTLLDVNPDETLSDLVQTLLDHWLISQNE